MFFHINKKFKDVQKIHFFYFLRKIGDFFTILACGPVLHTKGNFPDAFQFEGGGSEPPLRFGRGGPDPPQGSPYPGPALPPPPVPGRAITQFVAEILLATFVGVYMIREWLEFLDFYEIPPPGGAGILVPPPSLPPCSHP